MSKRNQINKVNHMKRSFFILAVLLLLGRSASAIGGIDVSIGPKVGYLSQKLSYQKADINAGFSNHFTLGAFARVGIGNLYVQPEVLWFNSSEAFNMSINTADSLGLPSSFTLTRKAMNIQVPVLVGYKLNLSDRLAVRGQVGPTANFIYPSKTLVEKSVSSGSNDIPEQLLDTDFDTKSVAWGFQIGAGIDILRLTLDINYNMGITKLFGEKVVNNSQVGQYIDTQNIEKTRQNLFMITIGYKLL